MVSENCLATWSIVGELKAKRVVLERREALWSFKTIDTPVFVRRS